MRTAEITEITKPKIKRVFDTLWSESTVMIVDRLTYSQQQFFEHAYDSKGKVSTPVQRMIHPDSIPFRELRPFLGKKTRITIEVID